MKVRQSTVDVEVNTQQSKLCSGCGSWKDQDQFHRSAASPDGMTHRCKPCKGEYMSERQRDPLVRARAQRYKARRQYNLTAERYDELMAPGCCAICGSTEPNGRRNSTFHIDHDHSCCPENGRSCGRCVRGILCSPCNTGLGRFRDEIGRLESAIRYLEGANI